MCILHSPLQRSYLKKGVHLRQAMLYVYFTAVLKHRKPQTCICHSFVKSYKGYNSVFYPFKTLLMFYYYIVPSSNWLTYVFSNTVDFNSCLL